MNVMHDYNSSFSNRRHKRDGRNRKTAAPIVSASSHGETHQARPYTPSESSDLVHGWDAQKYSSSMRATDPTRNSLLRKDRATAAHTKEENPIPPYKSQRQNHSQQLHEKAKYFHQNRDDSLSSSSGTPGFNTRQWVALLLSYPLYGTLSFYLSLLPSAGNTRERHADATSPKKVVYRPPAQAEVDYFLGEVVSKVVTAFSLKGSVEVQEEESEEEWLEKDEQKKSLDVRYFLLEGRHENSSSSSPLLRNASFSISDMKWRSRIPAAVDAFLSPIFGIAPRHDTSASSSPSSLDYGSLSLSEHLLLRLCYKERQRVDRYFNLFLEEQKKLEFFREDYLAHPPPPLALPPPVRPSGSVSSAAEEEHLSVSPWSKNEERPSQNTNPVKMKGLKKPMLTKGANGELYPWCYDLLPPPTLHSPTSSPPFFPVLDGSANLPNRSSASFEEKNSEHERLTNSLLAPHREGEGGKTSRVAALLSEAFDPSPDNRHTALIDSAPCSLRRRRILLSPSGSERSDSNEKAKEVVERDTAFSVLKRNLRVDDRSSHAADAPKSVTSTGTTFSAPAKRIRTAREGNSTLGKRNDGEYCTPQDSTQNVVLPAWQCDVCFDGDGDLFRCSHCKGLRHEACGGPRPASSFSPSSRCHKGGEGKDTCAVASASWSAEQDENEKGGVKRNTVPSRSTLCRNCANAMQLSDEERSSSSSSLRSSTSTDERDELGSLLEDEDNDSSLSGFIVHTSDDDDDDSSASSGTEKGTKRKDVEREERSRRASNRQTEDKKRSSSEEEVDSNASDDRRTVSKKKKKQKRRKDHLDIPVRSPHDPSHGSSAEASKKKRKRLAPHDDSDQKQKKRKTK